VVVAPPPAPVDQPHPKVAPAPASAAVAAPPPVAASAAAPPGPVQICSGRNPLAYFVCMERECLHMSKHPDCVKWHRNAHHD
ncbi:MAG: hypothetical protein KGL18_12420, partial [Burkholderiales bacterium]|nr:hypothetical protein [Burkholderiales bacterium]